ncbi:MAG: NTP transferase domain-containing protein, partial [Calditrichaeota bacterium]|nr:NTP transferase domain-containing protein [Calditrichota bacterium]
MSVAAVILAAGKSERFGSPKALARWGQWSFAEQIVEAARQAGLAPRVVVLGHAADRIAGALRGIAAEVVTNPDYEEGQFS